MLNVICLSGRLTRDPELRYTQDQTPVAHFSLAVERDSKAGSQTVDFIDCVAWRQTADFVSRYFPKGRPITVTGRLAVRDWTGKDGVKRRAPEVLVSSAWFAGPPVGEDRAVDVPPPSSGFEDLDDATGGELPF